MKRLTLGLAALLGLGLGLGAGAAYAAQIEITYQLETTYTLVGAGQLGPPTPGSMTVAYPSTQAGAPQSSTTGPGGTFMGANIPHGPVHLSLATLPPIVVNVTLGGDFITGTLAPTATGLYSLPGSLMSNGVLTLGPINIWDLGSLHCTGATCTALGFMSQSVPQMFTVGQAALYLVFPNAASAGSNLNTMFSGSAIVGSLFGYSVNAATSVQEVSRHYTPEPGTALLLGVGLGGLALLAGASRVRRAQR